MGTFPDLPPGPYELSEALILAAQLVPPGHAVSYGQLAGLLDAGGPRQAGRAMSQAPDGTCWWRIVRADGSLPASLSARAAPHYVAERTPLKGQGAGSRAASSSGTLRPSGPSVPSGAPDAGPSGAPDAGPHPRVDLARALWVPDESAWAVLAELKARLG